MPGYSDPSINSANDSIEVLQSTHDNLNANANLQVDNTDVSTSNRVPTELQSEYDINEAYFSENSGVFSLAIRNDIESSITQLDGNFAPLQVDSLGRLRVFCVASDLDIRDLDSSQDSVEVLQSTHDDLNANANLQVGDTDVGNDNPVSTIGVRVGSSTISSGIALNDTTSTTVLSSNTNRNYVFWSNPSNKDVWIKFQPASTDNDKKGIWIPAKSSAGDFMNYTGEISAISDSGTPDIYLTEY